jgi:ABC-type transport system involved in cytochrome c biogenesis permease subunit
LAAIPAIPFYLAVGSYLLAAGLALRFVRTPDESALVLAKRAAALGNTLLLAVFIYRWWKFAAVPFTGLGDSLSLFLVLCTGIMLLVQRRPGMRPLLVYYLPAVALIAVIAGLVAPKYLDAAPKELNGVLLTMHVGLVFLSFALFFVASLTSVAYAFKAHQLKRRATTGLSARLPALELLDQTLYRLIAAGYPSFIVTAVLGLGWAWGQRDLLGDYWFVSPKILLSYAMVALYAVSFHARQFGALRGPKLAYLVFVGFTFLLAVYLVTGIFHVGGASFWGAES